MLARNSLLIAVLMMFLCQCKTITVSNRTGWNSYKVQFAVTQKPTYPYFSLYDEEMICIQSIIEKQLIDKDLRYVLDRVQSYDYSWYIEGTISGRISQSDLQSYLSQIVFLRIIGESNSTLLTGNNLVNVSDIRQNASSSRVQNKGILLLQFDEEGQRILSEITSLLQGKRIHFFLGEEEILSASVNEIVRDGRVVLLLENKVTHSALVPVERYLLWLNGARLLHRTNVELTIIEPNS